MASKLIRDLTVDASPSLTDLIETCKDPSGTPSSRKVTLSSVLALGGVVKQMKNVNTGAKFTVSSGDTHMVGDDTIPQNTEGKEFMTLDFTPTNASNKLRIDVKVHGSIDTNEWVIAALFKDSDADALCSAGTYNNVATAGQNVTFTHWMTAGTTSQITFKVRVGSFFGSGSLMTFNGANNARLFGGVLISSMTITEVTP